MKTRARKISSTDRNAEYAALLSTVASSLYGIRLFVLDTLWNLKRAQRPERRTKRPRRKHAS